MIWMVWGVTLLVSVGTIVVPQFWWALSGWEFRDPDAMEPSDRQWRVLRFGAAVVAAACVAFLVGNLWPGDVVAQHTAGLTALIIGDGIIVAALLFWLLSPWGRRRRAAEDDPPPNEPSGAGYVLYVGGVVLLALIFVFVAATMLSTVSD